MEVKQLLEQIQQQYNEWKRERDQEQTITELQDVQQFLASYMYDYAITYKSNSDTLKRFIDGLYGLERVFERECSFDKFVRVYENVRTLKEPIRTEYLVKLMNDMEVYFKIPMLNNEEYNKKYPHVIHLYRAVSATRDI